MKLANLLSIPEECAKAIEIFIRNTNGLKEFLESLSIILWAQKRLEKIYLVTIFL
jgi:hypothetical protein